MKTYPVYRFLFDHSFYLRSYTIEVVSDEEQLARRIARRAIEQMDENEEDFEEVEVEVVDYAPFISHSVLVNAEVDGKRWGRVVPLAALVEKEG